MSKKLKARVERIFSDKSFNDLPYDERKRISKYITQNQIYTLWNIRLVYSDYISPALRHELNECVSSIADIYEREWGSPAENTGEGVDSHST